MCREGDSASQMEQGFVGVGAEMAIPVALLVVLEAEEEVEAVPSTELSIWVARGVSPPRRYLKGGLTCTILELSW